MEVAWYQQIHVHPFLETNIKVILFAFGFWNWFSADTLRSRSRGYAILRDCMDKYWTGEKWSTGFLLLLFSIKPGWPIPPVRRTEATS